MINHKTPAPLGRKTRKFWSNQHHSIQISLEKGESLQGVAEAYGVTTRHLRRVLGNLGIPYEMMGEAREAMNTNSVRMNWLTQACSRKGVSEFEREALALYLELPDDCPVLKTPLLYRKPTVNDPYSGLCAALHANDPDVGWVEGNITVMSSQAHAALSLIKKSDRKRFARYLTKVAD